MKGAVNSDDLAGLEHCPVIRYDGIGFGRAEAPLIREVALKIVYNHEQVMTIACAGNYPDELTVGFLRSEGLLRSAADIESLAVHAADRLVEVVTVDHRRVKAVAGQGGGALFSSGARGIGGGKNPEKKNLRDLPMALDPNKVLLWMEELVNRSVLHNTSHGTHCSALGDVRGMIISREDIGRHNTIDMIGGYALLNGIDCSDKILMTTGRISSEMVNKVWNLGIPVIITRSAPTAEAIRVLEGAGMTLVGYVRNGRMNIYTHQDRVNTGL
ncbi:MAG TPA: formate dehydrogenase accessory sulfurtransferase FdhD [Syntrophales bacterium]|nr:formate dehydrogenase accessory sulfurtransferase FdhD [Syntrophales bacterium]